MATDRLINQTQGEDIIDKLNEIASNVGDIKFGPQVQSSNVVSMTGYAEASTADAISQGDTLNEAIGKLEKKADDNASAVADKIDKLTGATAGDIATVTATGEIADSAVAIETTLSDTSDAKVPTSKAVGTYVDGKGYAVGVSTSTANHIVTFNGTDGKTLKDSGVTVATTADTTKDTEEPTSKAVNTLVSNKGYAVGVSSSTANQIVTFNSTDGKALKDSGVKIATTADTTKDTEVPTSKAVNTLVSNKGYAVGVSSSTANHIVAFNSTDGKALKDSGYTVNTTLTNVATDIPTGSAVSTALTGKVAGPGSSTSNDIMLFSDATGKVASDSGVQIEKDTNFSNTSDAKIPTSKSIAKNVAGKAVLTNYTVATAQETISASTTLKDAVEQLDYRTTTNQNSISLLGADISFTINPSTYELTARLLNSDGDAIGTAKTVDLPLESMVVDADYDDTNKTIVLTLKNGQTTSFSVADLVSGLQTELNSNNKLNPEYIAYDASHRAVSDTEKDTWNGKQNAISDLATIRSGAAAGATAVQPSVMEDALDNKQDSIDGSHKLSSDLVDDTNKTNKFVTSTEKDTWNSKQSALTTTQMQAVNSGITSEGVTQISTNQANILLVDEMNGARNECEYNTDVPVWTGVSVSITPNGIKMSGTTSTAWTGRVYDSSKISGAVIENLTEDYFCKRFGSIANVSVAMHWIDANNEDHYDNITASGLTIPAGSKLIDTIYVQKQSTTSVTISVDINLLICKKRYYDAGFTDYQPYAVPNIILTPAVAEEIDAGAKNLFDNSKAVAQTNLVWDPSSGTATQGNENDTKTNLALKLQCRSGSSGSFTKIFENRFVYANGVISIPFTCPIDAKEFQFGHNGSTKDVTMIVQCSISAGTQCVIQCNVLNCLQASGKYSWNKIMLCTQAAFGVSQKFVPYRPNWDLVANTVTYTNNIKVQSTGSISNANLDNITTSEERVYNNPTNLPSGTSGYVICRTITVDGQSAYQEIRFISSQINTIYGQSYPVFERRKVSGTWRDWNILDTNGSYRLDTGSSNATSKTIDISNIPDGVFLVTTRCSISATNRVGVSVYTLWIISSNYASSMFKSISETTNAKISSFSIASDGTATITYDGSGYHTTSLTRISI